MLQTTKVWKYFSQKFYMGKHSNSISTTPIKLKILSRGPVEWVMPDILFFSDQSKDIKLACSLERISNKENPCKEYTSV